MKAGYCSSCGENVYLDAQGACIKGHPQSDITGVYEVAESASAPTASVGASVQKTPIYKQTWFLPAAMLLLGLVLGTAVAGSPDDIGADVRRLEADARSLKAELTQVTAERDALQKELDPILRAEEASAAAAADAAKAKADAEAKAKAEVEAKAKAEADAKAKAEADAAAAAAAAAAEQAALEAANTFTDGIYLVGTDMKPGTYRGTLTSSMGLGYWARLKDATGSFDSIIANGTPTGPFVLTIKSSDYAVELTGVKLVFQQ